MQCRHWYNILNKKLKIFHFIRGSIFWSLRCRLWDTVLCYDICVSLLQHDIPQLFFWFTGDIKPFSTLGRFGTMFFICFAIIFVPQQSNELIEKMNRVSYYARRRFKPQGITKCYCPELLYFKIFSHVVLCNYLFLHRQFPAYFDLW